VPPDASAAAREFAGRGYVVVPNALGAEDVRILNAAIDDERRDRPNLWIQRSRIRADNFYALLANPCFDRTILNPRVLPLVKTLFGGEVCFDEFLVTVRAPCDHEPAVPMFHRDAPHLPDHPLALRHLAVLYYLTDHDPTTHRWAIVPEDVSAKRESPASTDGAGAVPVYGPAGTAVLFNAGSCHAVVRQQTSAEDRTIRVYFGHQSLSPIGNDTIVPRRLLGSRSKSVRSLFARTNRITELTRRIRS
jgi:hypothetical protein